MPALLPRRAKAMRAGSYMARRQLPGYVTFQKGTEYAFLGHDAATQDDDLGLQYGDDVAYGDGYVTGQVVNGPEGIGIAFGGHRKDGFAIEFVGLTPLAAATSRTRRVADARSWSRPPGTRM